MDQERLVVEHHGINFHFIQGGLLASSFDFATLLVTLTSSLTLLAIASTLVRSALGNGCNIRRGRLCVRFFYSDGMRSIFSFLDCSAVGGLCVCVSTVSLNLYFCVFAPLYRSPISLISNLLSLLHLLSPHRQVNFIAMNLARNKKYYRNIKYDEISTTL